jgi:hypothetical protein
MRIRFYCRLSFICNLCFLCALLLQFLPHPPQGEIVATTIVIGYLFAGALNIVVNLVLMVLGMLKKFKSAEVPIWLVVVNLIFLIPECILLFR